MIYTAVAEAVISVLRRHGGLHYLDDFSMFGEPDSHRCTRALHESLAKCVPGGGTKPLYFCQRRNDHPQRVPPQLEDRERCQYGITFDNHSKWEGNMPTFSIIHLKKDIPFDNTACMLELPINESNSHFVHDYLPSHLEVSFLSSAAWSPG